MQNRLLIALIAATCLSAPAMAQTTPSTTPTAQSQPNGGMKSDTEMKSDAGMSSGGIKMADTATVKVKYVTVNPADLMSSKLIGTNVYNNKKESVGEIEDLAIENGKTITGVVVSVGGFLGMGESYVMLDPSTIALSNKDGKLTAHVDTDKDALKNAPKFEYSKKKS